MPSVYLSPSNQEQQRFVTGNNEEYYMNLVADAMIPYLRASGIDFDRNDPGDTVQQIIEKSNSKYHDLHLMLNMESGLDELAGKSRGELAVYYTGSPGGKEAANIFARNLKKIYPNPELVTITSNRQNPELRDTNAAALMTVLGFRDNITDATWVINNIDTIAKNLVLSLAEYLKVPFADKASINNGWRYLSMPSVYLNPSNAQAEFIIGGSEEYYMNKIADAMVPYLRGSGIEVTRSEPDVSLSNSIEESNAGNYDLHIGLGSLATSYFSTGSQQGPIILYYEDNSKGKQAAEVIADNFKAIYPRPNFVSTLSNQTLRELKETKAPSVLVEVGYHNNTLDAYWIRDNIDAIGRILALGVSQYFGIPFVKP